MRSSQIIKLTILTLFVTWGIAAPSKAQLLERATSAKDVALLFHKMAEQPIDYEAWAKQTQEYATAVDMRKDAVLKQSKADLEIEYNAVDPKQSDIVIRTYIHSNVTDAPKVGLNLDFSADGPLFFPYEFMEQNYAVIAQNIDLLKFIPLGHLEAAYIRNKISAKGKTYMVLKVRPHRVDAQEKAQIYNDDFWLMLGRIASIHLYNKELETLWSWTAEWYINEQEEKAAL